MMKDLKIAIASSGLGHVARGIEAWASDLGQALAARGASIVLCKGAGKCDAAFERIVPCWTRESPRTRRTLARLPRFLGWRLGLGSGYGIEQTTFAWNLIRTLRREQIDILHVQDPQVALLMQRARAMGLIRTRTILAHGTEESLAFQRRITYLQHLAPWHLEESRSAGVWKPTWTAIPNFVDTEQFAPGTAAPLRRELGIPNDAMLVLTAAAIKKHHKRIDYLIHEFAALRSQHPELPVWLMIAGGWESDTDGLMAMGKELLADRVRFLVRFPRARMPELYRSADLFVLTSLKEMMPIALLEATASGLPCVVHEHPILQWMIGPGGIAGDLSRDGSLAAAVERLIRDEPARRDLGRLARKHCLENFGKDRVVEQILAYYDRVLQSSPETALAAS
ncbi:MAG: glycosyltransferase family 4 protein [Pirellulaceae bacterium]